MTNTKLMQTPKSLLGNLDQQRKFLLVMALDIRPCPACHVQSSQVAAHVVAQGDLDAYPINEAEDDKYACPACTVKLKVAVPLFGPEGWIWILNEKVVPVR